MTSIDELERQLGAKTAEQQLLLAEIEQIHSADLRARTDAACAEQARTPDAHALLQWIDGLIPATTDPATTDPVLAAIANVIGTYLVARSNLQSEEELERTRRTSIAELRAELAERDERVLRVEAERDAALGKLSASQSRHMNDLRRLRGGGRP